MSATLRARLALANAHSAQLAVTVDDLLARGGGRRHQLHQLRQLRTNLGGSAHQLRRQ